MERILCLATKRTDETVLICGKSLGHKGPHYDTEDKAAWDDELPLQEPNERDDMRSQTHEEYKASQQQ